MQILGSYVYMMTNQRNGTIYTGVTSDLIKRVWQHKNETADGFTKAYGLKTLVWYEVHDDIESAIQKEKQIKKWERKWKLRLIEDSNPNWLDLYETLD